MNEFQKDLEVFREKINTANQLIKALNQSNDVLIASKSKLDTLDKAISEVELRHQTLLNVMKSENSTLIAKTSADWQTQIIRMEEDFTSIKIFYTEFKKQLEEHFRALSQSSLDQSSAIQELIKLSSQEQTKNAYTAIEYLEQLRTQIEKTKEKLESDNLSTLNKLSIRHDLIESKSEILQALIQEISQQVENDYIGLQNEASKHNLKTSEEINRIFPELSKLQTESKEQIDSLAKTREEMDGLFSKQVELISQNHKVNHDSLIDYKNQLNKSIQSKSEKLSAQTQDQFNQLTAQVELLKADINTNFEYQEKQFSERYESIIYDLNKKYKFSLYLISAEIIVSVSLILYFMLK